jgi:Na+-translocating ferredoxin:NAD+ oxidoreductase subunit D
MSETETRPEEKKVPVVSRMQLVTSPHAHTGWSTSAMMWLVTAALLPSLLAGVIFFGWRALLLVAATIVGAVGAEWLINIWRKQPFSLFDGSALLTGLLLGLILPPSFPLLGALLGGVIAIGLGKAVFGGLGANIFNPALVGRAFLQAAFPVAMTTWTINKLTVDAVSSATPLAIMKFRDAGVAAIEAMTPYGDMLMGTTAGCLGETSAVAVLIGGAVLLFTKVANWRIPLAMAIGAVALGGIFWLIDPTLYPNPLFHLLSGGFLFGALFMATDLVTSPLTGKGMWYFGIGIGILTVLIRLFGGLPEGVMYSILLMNTAVPLINRWTRPKIFGEAK